MRSPQWLMLGAFLVIGATAGIVQWGRAKAEAPVAQAQRAARQYVIDHARDPATVTIESVGEPDTTQRIAVRYRAQNTAGGYQRWVIFVRFDEAWAIERVSGPFAQDGDL